MIIAATALVSCSRQSGPATPPERPPVPVTVARSELRDVPVEIQAVGNVEPIAFVTVRPQVTGIIQEVHFREGQEVREGDLLVTLDPRPWRAALNQAEANLRRDEAQLVNARLEFLRTSNLFASQILAEQDFQAAEAAFQAAVSVVAADAAAVTNAQVNLGYTEIRAPISGRTGALSAKAGNVIKAPDDAVVTITQVSPVNVAFGVPEQHLAAIRRRAAESELPARAYPPGAAAEASIGRLEFIDNQVNTQTGTVLLKATFENGDQRLWPGQFVQAVLTLSNLTGATVVPAHAVQFSQNGEFVFVVKEDQSVEARPVKAGVRHEGMAVIVSGLKPGETVVTDGQMRLTPGAKVNVKGSEPGRTRASAATVPQ